MTEHAVLLTPREAGLARPEDLRAEYSRVCLGSPFCMNLLPSPSDVARLRAAGLEVTIVTPLLTGGGLAAAEKLLRGVLRSERSIEVSVADLGLLDLIRRDFPGRCVPLLGRPVSHDFARMSPVFLRRFFRANGIAMIETDETAMPGALSGRGGPRLAFHYPYSCVAFTRFCPHEGKVAAGCSFSCVGKEQRLKGPGGKALVLRDNAYLRANTVPPGLRPSRLVYCPPRGGRT